MLVLVGFPVVLLKLTICPVWYIASDNGPFNIFQNGISDVVSPLLKTIFFADKSPVFLRISLASFSLLFTNVLKIHIISSSAMRSFIAPFFQYSEFDLKIVTANKRMKYNVHMYSP